MKEILFSIVLIGIGWQVLAQEQNIAQLKQQLRETDDETRIQILGKLSDFYLKKSPDVALTYGLERLEWAENIDDFKGIVAAQYQIGKAYFELSQPLKALSYYDRTLDMIDSIAFEDIVRKVYQDIGESHFLLREFPTARTYFSRSLNFYKESKYRKEAAYLMKRTGDAFAEEFNFDDAFPTYENALKLSERAKDYELSISIYIKVGQLYLNLEQLGDASINLQRGLEKAKRHKNTQAIGLAKQAYARFYLKKQQYEKAQNYQLEALEHFQEVGDSLAIGNILFDLSNTFVEIDSIGFGLEYGTKSLQYYRMVEDKKGTATLLNHLGRIFRNFIGDDQAIEYLQEALSINNDIDNKFGTIESLLSLAELYFQQDKHDRVLTFTNRAMKLAQEVGDASSVRRASFLLAQSHGHRQEFEEAFISQQLYDSLNEEESSRQIQEIQTQYQDTRRSMEVEKRNFARRSWISILLVILGVGGLSFFAYWYLKKNQKEIKDLKAALNELKTEQEKQEKRIQEQIGNNLQVISSILNIQTYINKGEKTISAFQTEQSRLKTIALFQQKLYQNPIVGKINFQEYVEQLLSFLDSMYHDPETMINYQIQIQPTQLEIDKALPLGLIINELVSNAYKHAFEDKNYAKINISFVETENNWKLKVSDNGVGVSEHFTNEHQKGMGLKIINKLARPLKAKLKVEKEDDWNHFVVA